MKRTEHICAAIIVSCISACGSSDSGGTQNLGPSRNERIILTFEPEDLASDIGVAPVRMILQPYGGFVPAALAAQVRSLILVTNAETGQPVEIDFELMQDNTIESQSSDKNAEYPTYFEIRPTKGSWPGGWNEIRVSGVPVLIEPAGMKEVETGWVTRFTTASRPTLQMFEVCPKSEAVTSIIIRFSEPIDGGAASSHVWARQGDRHCSIVHEPSLSARRVTLSCTGLNLKEPFSVGVEAGLQALNGKPVTLYSGNDSLGIADALYDELGFTQEGCRGLHF